MWAKKHIDYLLTSLRKHYSKVTVDCSGSLYAGITLEWNYKERWLDTCMPNYINKLRQHFNHREPSKPDHSPYKAPPTRRSSDLVLRT